MSINVKQSLSGSLNTGMRTDNYKLPVAGDELGGVKNGGNVTINEDGTMTAPESVGATEAQAKQIETNKRDIANKLDKSGWTANKFLGTDDKGNVVERDAPDSLTALDDLLALSLIDPIVDSDTIIFTDENDDIYVY